MSFFFCKLKKFGDGGCAHLQEDLDFIVLGVCCKLNKFGDAGGGGQ